LVPSATLPLAFAQDAPVTAIGSPVGVDMGIVRFATLSDGGHLEPINSFRRHEIALRKAQQSMARKVKYSRNWSKAKERVQRIHARIVNVRRDYLHKATTTICNNHAVVVVEELRVRNMTKSAAGTCTAPGKHVRAKSGLNKAILDQGWFEFRRQLAYKLAWRGGELIAVPPHHTSQTCPACGVVSPENRRTQAVFSCIGCGYENHADVVGAINILRRGEAMMCSEARDGARFACVVNGATGPSSAGTHLCA
jgi:putative transposase